MITDWKGTCKNFTPFTHNNQRYMQNEAGSAVANIYFRSYWFSFVATHFKQLLSLISPKILQTITMSFEDRQSSGLKCICIKLVLVFFYKEFLEEAHIDQSYRLSHLTSVMVFHCCFRNEAVNVTCVRSGCSIFQQTNCVFEGCKVWLCSDYHQSHV
jgi:hypothetical protein